MEQKARREDVLNQLLLLLNTAINRKQKEDSRLLTIARTPGPSPGSKDSAICVSLDDDDDDISDDDHGELFQVKFCKGEKTSRAKRGG